VERKLAGAFLGFTSEEAISELLLILNELMQRFGCTYRIKVGHLSVYRSLLEQQGYGFRLSRLLEERMHDMQDREATERLIAQLKDERGHAGTESFIDQYQQVAALLDDAGKKAEGEQQLTQLFEGFLSTLDVSSLPEGNNLKPLISRLIEKAAYQRDCRRASDFLSKVHQVALKEEQGALSPEEIDDHLKEWGGKNALAAWQEVRRVVESLVDYVDDADEIVTPYVYPDNYYGYYTGWAVEVVAEDGRMLGHAGTVAPLIDSPADDNGSAELETIGFQLNLDALEPLTALQEEKPARLVVASITDAVDEYARQVWWDLYWSFPRLQVVLDVSERSPRKILKAALSAESDFLVLLGDQELADGTLTIKRLADQEQKTFDRDAEDIGELIWGAASPELVASDTEAKESEATASVITGKKVKKGSS
jgi:histidyl-tRNA synthetase